jgi:hypothetical protein
MFVSHDRPLGGCHDGGPVLTAMLGRWASGTTWRSRRQSCDSLVVKEFHSRSHSVQRGSHVGSFHFALTPTSALVPEVTTPTAAITHAGLARLVISMPRTSPPNPILEFLIPDLVSQASILFWLVGILAESVT